MKKNKREKITLEKLRVIEETTRKSRFVKSVAYIAVIFIVMVSCCIGSYVIRDNSKAEYIRTVYNKTSADYLWTDSTVSPNLKEKMINFIENLPSDMRTRIKEDWTIVVCKEIPQNLKSATLIAAENYDTSNLKNGGFTYNSNRIVYVCSDFKENIVYSSFMHEIGHLVSFEKGCVHGTDEWIAVYNEESVTYPCDGYYSSNSAEFFANTFMEYYSDTDRLNEISPEMHDFMANVMSNHVDRNTMNIFEETALSFMTGVNSFKTFYYMYS